MRESNERHNEEIKRNLASWESKPLLQAIYKNFYRTIIGQLNNSVKGDVVEIGSGIGNLKAYYPDCICTDLFPNPWIDRVESAYMLSFPDNSVSNIILFDVFHHLEYPGEALKEFHRVLSVNGRVIIFDPCLSLFGLLVYGVFHHEPVGLFRPIQFYRNHPLIKVNESYYAAQGNAYRVFTKKSKYMKFLGDWNFKLIRKFSAFSYIVSGGFSRPSLYPFKMLGFMQKTDTFLNRFPFLFATRLLVVIEKK